MLECYLKFHQLYLLTIYYGSYLDITILINNTFTCTEEAVVRKYYSQSKGYCDHFNSIFLYVCF